LSGGANAIDGCVLLSLEMMTAIENIDLVERTATVQPGVVNARLKEAAAEVGLWYPPDPASYEMCTIGGNIATNAGGLCCVKYGVTRDWVQSLEVVLADGRLITAGAGSRKDVVGYDVRGLLVGSEGTLGVVTRAVMRLREPPGQASTLVAFLPDLAAAGAGVASICMSTTPALLEIMDQTSIVAVDDWTKMALDRDAVAMLLVQSDAETLQLRRQELNRIEEACGAAGATYLATTHDPEEGELFLAARRLVYPSLERAGATLLDDVAVPRARLAELLERVPSIADVHDVRIAVFGHAGDGNLHPTLVFPHGDEAAVRRARRAFAELLRLSLELGGSLTGEHGVGLLKVPFVEDQLGPDALAVHRAIKSALDPNGILNPGKLI